MITRRLASFASAEIGCFGVATARRTFGLTIDAGAAR
jgi:hypothetical protein